MPRSRKDNSPYLFIGEVTKPHGVHGALAIRQWRSGPPPEVPRVVLKHPRRGRIIELTVKRWARRSRSGWIIFPEDIHTREESELYRGYLVGIYREDLPPLEDGEFYLEDIIGSRLVAVLDDAPKEVGTIKGIVPGPMPYPLLLVDTGDGEKLIPLPEEKIINISYEESTVVIEKFTDFDDLE